MSLIFQDRIQAGHLLADRLKARLDQDPQNTVILALPRGGLPVAYEISKALSLPLDVLIVRKIGHPLQPEYGIGAIAEGGSYWIDPDAVQVTEALRPDIQKTIQHEIKEIERRVEQYRTGHRPLSLTGKTVILVDDGLATGVTARVAAKAAYANGAKKVILAVPVCSDRTAKALKNEIDDVVCLSAPPFFMSVGQFYQDFTQVSDKEVMKILARSRALFHEDPKEETLENSIEEKEVEIPNEEGIQTHGILSLPKYPIGLVIFAHGSKSGRFSPRNQHVAHILNRAGIGTLLIDLLAEFESEGRANVFDIPLLASRLTSATRWVRQQEYGQDLPIGYFGASTGGGVALWAAADLPGEISAIVSRGGRPDLALSRLAEVNVPTLLIVGDLDKLVIPLNEIALAKLKLGKLNLIPGATHLFEEPGTLELVAEDATDWFLKYLPSEKMKSRQKVKKIKGLKETHP
ncbi:MAG: phosphoribosyltransferase family protein [Pseudobdellovibrionaceae bacterium]